MPAVDPFLRAQGVEGESADGRHKGEIDVGSWSWGAAQAGPVRAGWGLKTDTGV